MRKGRKREKEEERKRKRQRDREKREKKERKTEKEREKERKGHREKEHSGGSGILQLVSSLWLTIRIKHRREACPHAERLRDLDPGPDLVIGVSP